MNQDMSRVMIQNIMLEFTDTTENPPRRYLWTDAFAVCNFLELYRQTGDKTYEQYAIGLVNQAHDVLGRYREDDPRTAGSAGSTRRTAGLIQPGEALGSGKGYLNGSLVSRLTSSWNGTRTVSITTT